MSKINHSRPVLRYIDNVRREAARPGVADWRTGPMQPATGRGLSSVMVAFDELPDDHRGIFNLCLARFGEFLEAQAAYIEAIGKRGASRGRKAAAEAARAALVEATAVLIWMEVEAAQKGYTGALTWYGKFHRTLSTDDRRAWEWFDGILFVEAPQFLGIPVDENLILG